MGGAGRQGQREGTLLDVRVAGRALAGSGLSIKPCYGEEGEKASPVSFPTALWGWARRGVCCKGVMDFIRYAELLLTSLEICKIEAQHAQSRFDTWSRDVKFARN